ncbi:hypothetical protein EB118_04225 [bacterium]|nr:hypothetical protein [bacterium]
MRKNKKQNLRQANDSQCAGKKFDGGKVRVDLLPTESLFEVAKVLGFGADKYGEHNWRKGIEWSRVYAAAQRHMMKWNAGETHDEESGMNHLAHACVNLLFLLSYDKNHPDLDDRYRSDNTP